MAVNKEGNFWLTVGRTGSEYSETRAIWVPLSEEGFYVCAIGGQVAYAAGRGGKLVRMYLP